MSYETNNTNGTTSKPKVSKLRIFFVVFLSVILVAVLVFDILVDRSSDFTEKEHLARVTELAKKRYLKDGEPYTDLQVYPVYNQNDKLTHFIIELEPVGYMTVNIQRTNMFSSMYTRGTDDYSLYWSRYVAEKGAKALRTDLHKQVIQYPNRRWTELDENNEPIKHFESPFKAAGIQNEKRYFLKIDKGHDTGHIYAVKRDGKYLNVITMEYMNYDYAEDDNVYPAEGIGDFPVNHWYDL